MEDINKKICLAWAEKNPKVLVRLKNMSMDRTAISSFFKYDVEKEGYTVDGIPILDYIDGSYKRKRLLNNLRSVL